MQIIEKQIIDNLEELLTNIPPFLSKTLKKQDNLGNLIEVVMDLGRLPEARYTTGYEFLSKKPITKEDIAYVVGHVGEFGEDNRAGIEKSLHRISCIRNRRGEIIGLTCRVGRAIQGTVDIIRDLVESGRSILALGRPGSGKTTKLREIARILADDMHKRVVVIDTSNEIAGDGDIPHPAIGRARRMQVKYPSLQHAVMIEAVENHMPEVIIIDEISTKEEADAARTIAERGVQLIGTAHGNSIENIILNPSLNDLVGGIESVTLGDEEAKRRGTQKTVLERKSPPTFEVCIEVQDRYQMAIHLDVSEVVDQYLRGVEPQPEVRIVDESGNIKKLPSKESSKNRKETSREKEETVLNIYPYAVSRSQLERVIKTMRIPAKVTKNLDEANVLMILQSYKKHHKIMDAAANRDMPVYMVKTNTIYQIQRTLRQAAHSEGASVDMDVEELFREMGKDDY